MLLYTARKEARFERPLQANWRFFFFPGVESNCFHLWVPGAFLWCKDVKDDQKNKLLLVAEGFLFVFRLGRNKEVLFEGRTSATGGMALPLGFNLPAFAVKSATKHRSFCLIEGPYDLLVMAVAKCLLQSRIPHGHLSQVP